MALIVRSCAAQRFVHSRTRAILRTVQERCKAVSGARTFAGTVEHLRHPSATGEVFLVGTSHISKASADQVHEVVQAVRPSYVVVELCEGRRQRLESQRASRQHTTAHDQGASAGGIFEAMMRGFQIPGVDFAGGAFMGALSAFYALLRKAGLDPGADMVAGIDAAAKVDAKLICGDVSVEETARRLRSELFATDLPALMAAFNKPEVQTRASALRLDRVIDIAALLRGDHTVANRLAAASEQLKDRESVRDLIGLMDAAAPRLVAVMLHNRDAHIANLLRSPPLRGSRTVCVVGLAHMDGIVRRYLDPTWKGDPPLPEPPRMPAGGEAEFLKSLMVMLNRMRHQ